MELTISELAQRLSATLFGDGSGQVTSVGPVKTADANTLTFVTDEKHKALSANSKAAAVITGEYIEELPMPQLIVKDVNVALIEALKLFAPELKPPAEGIDPSAKVGNGVKIAKGVSIGFCVMIDDVAEIGTGSIIAAGCKIGQNSKIGANCRLDSNVVVYHNCTIGNNVVIQANTTIGSTGFGYTFINGAHRLIPHNGSVVIEDFVDIGANCCIDRAKFGNTIIGAGTKIDNLVQIAHNVVIGKCCLIVSQAGIAGSSKLGDGVVLAGQSGVTDNVEIGNGVIVGGGSGVTHNVAAGQQLFGTPAMEKTEAFRIIGLTRRLPRLAEQIIQMDKKLEKLEASISFHSRLKWIAGITTAAAAVILMGFFVSPYARAIFDPHEYEVEKIVNRYQDGNGNFYVSASSRLEDLHTSKSLFIIVDVTEAPGKIITDHARMRDSYFLVSYKDLEKLKKTTAWKQLLLIKEVDVEGQQLVLLGTKASVNLIKPKV